MTTAVTTLAAAMLIADTTASVRDVHGFASSADTDDVVLIGSEFLLVAGGLGTTSWSSITRGYGGSTAAAHSSGDAVTRIERGWVSLLDVKDWIDYPADDNEDDDRLLTAIEATNAYVTQCVGRFIGPSTDTTRTYRRIEPDEDGRVLWIPGGIRSFTTLELRRASTDAWETVTAGDIELGPPSWDLRPGQAYQWLEFIDDPAGAWLSFPRHGELRISGARFGPEMPDPSAAQIARTVVTRMWEAREEGSLRNPTPSKFVYSDDMDVLRALGMEHVAGLS